MVARGKLDPANFQPGAQMPQKYPQIGNNYKTYGEVKGMVYDPWSDSYYKDKKAYEEYIYSTGQAERPKEPSLLEQVAPVAAVGGAYALSQAAGDGLAGMFGSSAAPAAATQAAGSGVAGATGAASNLTGLQGLGAGSVAAPTGVTSQVVPVAADSGGLLSGLGGLGIVPTAAIAAGTYLGGKSAYDMIRGKEDDSTQGKIGRGLLGIATGGISEIARPFAMHESTREATQKNTNNLLKQSDDPQFQSYVQGMREQYKTAPTGAAFAGKYNSFDEYKAAGLEANDLTGVYGNIKAFGADWAKLDQAKRQEITQALINADLYESKKGDVVIKDEAKAKAIYQGLVGAKPAGQAIPRPTVSKEVEQKALENWK